MHICTRRGKKTNSAGHTETGAYVGGNRELDAGFCVKWGPGVVGANASAPTVQLQRIRAVLGVIAYRKWNS